MTSIDFIKELLSFKADDKKTLIITYGNGETVTMKNDSQFLFVDEWLVITIKENVEHIKLESIYKITAIGEENDNSEI